MLIAMVVHNDVRRDARVMKEAISLRQAGHDVCIYGLTQEEGDRGFRFDEDRIPVMLTYRAEPNSSMQPLVGLSNSSDAATAQLAETFSTYMKVKLTARTDRIRRSFSFQGALLASAVLEGPKPDAVHIHDHVALTAASVYKRTLGVPVIWDAHEIYQELADGDEERAKASASIIADNAPLIDRFVTINPSIAKYYADSDIGLPPAVVLPNASLKVDALDYDGRLHALTGLPREKKILLFQGGFGRHRGIEQLVQAAPSLNEGWTVVLMGWGPLREEMKRQAAEHPRDADGKARVLFIDGVPQAELAQWTAGASLGAIPYENSCLNHLYCTPNKLWEYPLAGVPILASDLEEMGRAVREHGIGVTIPRAFTTDDIANAVNALSDDQLQTMRDACQRYAQANHWSAFDKRLKDMYATLTESKVRSATNVSVTGFTAVVSGWKRRSPLRRTASKVVREVRRVLKLGRYSSKRRRATRTLSNADTAFQRKQGELQRLLAVERMQRLQLKETVNDVRKKVREQQAVIEDYREKLATARTMYRNARTDARDIDPIAHNTAGAMDEFFSQEESDEPYREFAVALKQVLAGRDIALDGKSVLDVGVGPGTMLAGLITNATPASVVGLDFSAAAIARARTQMPQGRFEVASVYDPIEERGDVVFCTEVLEHLEEPERALANILGAVTPEGVAVLTVPDGRVDFSRYHVNFWSPESWDRFVRRVAAASGSFDCEIGQFRVRESSSYANNYAIVRRTA